MARSKKTEMVFVRVSAADKEAMLKAAERAEMTLSEFIRAAALAYMALRLDRHALRAALRGGMELLKEFEESGRQQFLRGKVKA